MRNGLVLAAIALASCSSEERASDIAVRDAWARATVAGQSSSAAYFTIVNSGGADRLIAVSTPVADASIHSTSFADGIVRMRALETLDVAEGAAVKLEPGKVHVMLTGLKQPLEAGARVPMELRFERSGERQLELEVRAAGGAAR